MQGRLKGTPVANGSEMEVQQEQTGAVEHHQTSFWCHQISPWGRRKKYQFKLRRWMIKLHINFILLVWGGTQVHFVKQFLSIDGILKNWGSFIIVTALAWIRLHNAHWKRKRELNRPWAWSRCLVRCREYTHILHKGPPSYSYRKVQESENEDKILRLRRHWMLPNLEVWLTQIDTPTIMTWHNTVLCLRTAWRPA